MKLHPALSYNESEEMLDVKAVQTFSFCWESKRLLLSDISLLEDRIKEIKTTNHKGISIREYNKLNKELFTLGRELEEIESKLDACDIYFSNVTVGTLN